MSASKLIRPSTEYKDDYLAALAEYHAEGRYLSLKMKLLQRTAFLLCVAIGSIVLS